MPACRVCGDGTGPHPRWGRVNGVSVFVCRECHALHPEERARTQAARGVC